MSFGYIPHKTPWKNMIQKIIGYPSMIRRIQAPVIIRMLNPQKDDVVLDVGCGGGFFTYEIAKICRCIGIDLNINKNLSYAMSKLPSVSYIKADVQKMPFKEGMFDKILLSSVLQMVENDRALLKECYRVLKESGILVLSVPIEYTYIRKLNEFKNELIEKFGSRGKGFYGYDKVLELLQKEGFEIMETEYAPKRLGSFIYETWLYFCYRVGLPLFHPFYFLLLYPLAYFDRFDSKKQKGNEVIIKAKKDVTIINKPNILIVADKEDVKHLDIRKETNYWNIFWKIIDYDKLHKNIDEIENQIKKYDVHFVLYSRNDQVVKKIGIGRITKRLKIGYSSFSGIDEKYRIEEMKNCFEDFMRYDNRLGFGISPPKERNLATSESKGTFSLVFDTEQIGGVRYGLPRILELLNKHDVKAIFFVTNLMKKVYSNVIEEICAQGHEIGLHGKWHEYLSKYSKDEQTKLIKEMLDDFGIEIFGANFIGRMNEDTTDAMLTNRVKYFVYPLINYYRFFCYPKLPTKPLLLSIKGKKIWIAPISVETYGRPWSLVKNMIDSVLFESTKTNHHLNILLHPFRDGNLSHIEDFKKLLEYLTLRKKMRSIKLIDYIDSLNPDRVETINNTNQLKKFYRTRSSIPQTKQDLTGFIPENILLIRRLIKKYRQCLIA